MDRCVVIKNRGGLGCKRRFGRTTRIFLWSLTCSLLRHLLDRALLKSALISFINTRLVIMCRKQLCRDTDVNIPLYRLQSYHMIRDWTSRNHRLCVAFQVFFFSSFSALSFFRSAKVATCLIRLTTKEIKT